MKTDYNKINLFEASVVAWSFIGLALIGGVFLSSMTPKNQTSLMQAVGIFDIHEHLEKTADGLEFVLNIPNEFNKQFYIAFTQVMELPRESYEFPAEVAREIISGSKIAINELASQAMESYQQQQQIEVARAQILEPKVSGQISGAVIDLTEPPPIELNLPYSYPGPNLDEFINLNIKPLR
jgi:hypothetical protein